MTAAGVLAVLLPSAAAEAVIPSAFGPIQALLVLLPQILLALAAALVALLKPRTYKLLGAYCWAHKTFTLTLVAGIGLLAWSPWRTGVAAAAEQTGTSWPSFRGGSERRGSVAGARGPQGIPRPLWNLAGDALGPSASVDSSPAVVGNRLYFGLSNLSAFGASGAICAADARTGALAWKWTGGKELDPPLRPVFSSPSVWVEDGAARYVVSGEGYHEDRDCRILCLDLKGGPKLAWAVATTSHVESAPALHDGRATIGCGDDGVWCIELATGRVLWRIEGGPLYEVEGAALDGLAGKRVVVTGTVAREGLGAGGKDDPGVVVFREIREFREHAGPPVTASPPSLRTVTGTVEKPPKGRTRIAVDFFNPDSESPPATAGSRVLFGSGLGGTRVTCADAATGAPIWKTPTPYPAFGAPAVSGDRVVIGVGKGNFVASDPQPAGAIVCLSLQDGRELWKVLVGDTVIGAVALHEDRAYAASRDGNVHVLDLATGKAVAKLSPKSPLVSSPAVTADAVYVSADSGSVYGFDRLSGALRFSLPLTPGSPILSSPAVADGKLFVGTRSRGLFASADPSRDRGAAGRPWSDPGRTGCADDLGPPLIDGDEAPAATPSGRPPALDASDTIRAHDLVFSASGGKLTCASDLGAPLWSVDLECEFPPSMSGDKVFVCGKQVVEARRITDGALAWRRPLDAAALSYPVATREWVAVATADDRIALFRAADGTPVEPVQVGGKPVAPAICGGVLIVAGEQRIAAYDLASAEWMWNFKDQDRIGAATGQPVISNETIWVGTTKLGLVAIGAKR